MKICVYDLDLEALNRRRLDQKNHSLLWIAVQCSQKMSENTSKHITVTVSQNNDYNMA